MYKSVKDIKPKYSWHYFPSHRAYIYISCLLVTTCSIQAQTQSVDDDQLSIVRAILSQPVSNTKSLLTCAYTQRTTRSDVGSRKERFDPSVGLGLEWQLLSVNEKEPTDQQLNHYEPNVRARHPAILNLDYIAKDSLQLLDQSQSRLLFAFEVLPGKSTGLNQHVSNQLTIDSDRKELIELKSAASAPFHIHPWMRVQEYESISTFRYEEQTKGSVLEQVVIELKVKAGGKTLHRRITMHFSDFECTLPSTDLLPIDVELDPSAEEVDVLVPIDSSPNSDNPTTR